MSFLIRFRLYWVYVDEFGREIVDVQGVVMPLHARPIPRVYVVARHCVPELLVLTLLVGRHLPMLSLGHLTQKHMMDNKGCTEDE